MVLETPARQVKPPAHEPADVAWWARGDAPVRVAEAVAPLVDGRSALLAMCVAFLTARRSIWLADWSLYARLRLVRGQDQRAGKDGSPEQYALIDRLRAAGLDHEAISLWESGGLRLVDVLGFAARRGVEVRVLLWGPFNPGGLLHMVNDAGEQRRVLERAGVECRLDKSNRSPFHVAQALHQKCAVVDGRIAFLGGIDPTVEYGGDFDRWDTQKHHFQDTRRTTESGPVAHPWHDAHMLLTGAPAADVEQNIRQRWEEANLGWWHKVTPPLKHLAQWYLSLLHDVEQAGRPSQSLPPPEGAGPPLGGLPARVQVVRTIPALTYRFAPAGVHGIAEAYRRAIQQAKRFIYLESQYLWLEGFPGIDSPRLGWQSRYMRAFLTELAEVAERGVTIALVLPDHPNAGRAYTDKTIDWLHRHAPQAAREGRLHFFCLAASEQRAHDGLMRYRPIYVHAKVGIVDDAWATIGSANLNSRGMSHDAEINLALLDNEFAHALRLFLWAEHAGILHQSHASWPEPAILPAHPSLVPRSTGVSPAGVGSVPPASLPAGAGLMTLIRPAPSLERLAETNGAAAQANDLKNLEDPLAGIALLAQRAQQNLERLRSGEPLVGHLLPYLRAGVGQALGLTVDHERGLLDPLRGVREGVHVRHPHRYT